ncbi:hypothetical protein [Treponema berlinense]|uniref:hypothetical protein n=1 Tax=Treponema berlinense TaxID=225004 RepID=UPI001F38EA68|nr:hypothetical protein [Treponema berlinense]
MAENSSEFKPYILADKITPEFTITSILTGIILAIVFGAAKCVFRFARWNDNFRFYSGGCYCNGYYTNHF